jgi:hypothetical protein
MSWINHHGLGCPVPFYTIVETEDPTGERHVGQAGDQMNIDENGSSWIWEEEEPKSWEISRYRVLDRKGLDRVLVAEEFR